MSKKRLLGAICALLTSLSLSTTVRGALVTMNPDDFALSAPLNNAWAGITLSVSGTWTDPSTGMPSPGVYLTGDVSAAEKLRSPTPGDHVFGLDRSDGTSSGGLHIEGAHLILNFSSPTDFVEVVFGTDSWDYISSVSVFDSTGQLIEELRTPQTDWQDSVVLTVSHAERDIKQVDISTIGGTMAYAELITVNAVPLPAAVWLFGSGLLGLIGIASRKKHS